MERQPEAVDAGGTGGFERVSQASPVRELDNRTYTIATLARWADAVNSRHRLSGSAPVHQVPASFAGRYVEMLGRQAVPDEQEGPWD